METNDEQLNTCEQEDKDEIAVKTDEKKDCGGVQTVQHAPVINPQRETSRTEMYVEKLAVFNVLLI